MKKLIEWAKQENCTITIKPEKVGSMVKVIIGNNDKKIAVEQRLDPEVLAASPDKKIYNKVWEGFVDKYDRIAYPERFKVEEPTDEATEDTKVNNTNDNPEQ